MYCEKCGQELSERSVFCKNCGAKVAGASAQQMIGRQAEQNHMESNPNLPEGIMLDEKGNYRWTYRLDMIKAPVLRNMLMKIMFFSCLGVGVFLAVIQLIAGADLEEMATSFCIIVFGIGGGLSLLTFIMYYIVIPIHGSIYTVDHVMNEKGIEHIQSPEENERSEKMKKLVLILNLLNPDPAMMGMTMAAKEHLVSEYKDVKKVVAARRYNLIKVNNTLQHNHIYAYPHQYEFVWNYVVSHCPKAKTR